MSAVPATRPVIERRVRTRVVPPSRVVEAPATRARRKAKTRSNALAATAVHALAFFAVSGSVFLASSLWGNVLTESARQQGIEATGRAREARRAEASLRRQLDVLMSLDSVQDWASAHGFRAPDVPVRPSVTRSSLVATNH